MMFPTAQTLFDQIDVISGFPNTMHPARKTDRIRYAPYDIIRIGTKCS